MTISVLQDRQSSAGGSFVSSIALAFTSNVTAGSACHAIGAHSGVTTTVTYSDNNSNTWPSGRLDEVNDTVSVLFLYQQVAQNMNAGATTVTTTFGATRNFPCLWIKEIGGVATTGNPDGHNSVTSTSTTSQNLTCTSTAQPALVSVLTCNGNTQEVPSLDATYTASAKNPGWNFGGSTNSTIAGHKRVTATGTQSVTNTQASADALSTLMAVFTEAATAGTVALTGQGATFTAGTLVPSGSVALTGQAGTFASGTLTATRSVSLNGQAATWATGTLTPSASVPVTGQAVTFAAGALTPSATLALLGGSASFATGNLLASSSLALTGQASTFSAGTLAPSSSIPLVGLSATFTAGFVTVQGDVTVALTGQSATFSTGTLTAQGADVQTQTQEVPAGRRVRTIYRVRIDGQVFECRTYAEAIELLAQARKTAEVLAERQLQTELKKPPVPRITANTRELRKAVTETRKAIAKTYDDAFINAELRMLFEIARRREEDDTLLLLM